MFDQPEALLNHTFSKSCYLIHELFLTNAFSFQELVSFRTPYLPFPFLNPTTYPASNLTSTNLISSPYLLNFPVSFFFCQEGGLCYRLYGPSLALLNKTKKPKCKSVECVEAHTFWLSNQHCSRGERELYCNWCHGKAVGVRNSYNCVDVNCVVCMFQLLLAGIEVNTFVNFIAAVFNIQICISNFLSSSCNDCDNDDKHVNKETSK